MTYQITPQQQRYNDPLSQTLFQYDTPKSNVYLSRPLNFLFRIFGDNITLQGLDLDSYTIDDNNVVSVVINPGNCIVDTIYHEILERITLSLDVSGYDDQNGRLVVSVNYKFLQTLENNPLRLKLSYVSNDGSIIQPASWDATADKLVLAVLNFDKTNKTITLSDQDSIDILGKTYIINGYNETTRPNLYNLLHGALATDFGYYYQSGVNK